MTPHPGQLGEMWRSSRSWSRSTPKEFTTNSFYALRCRRRMMMGQKRSHHVSSWLVLAAPPCECLIFGHKCCPRRVANFKIEFTIWIELLTDLAGLCFSPYSVSTQSETTKDCQTLTL